MPSVTSRNEKIRIIPGLLFLLLLWLQLCVVLAPSWAGGYYDYGWLVPPVVAFLAYLRWQDRLSPQSAPAKGGWIRVTIALFILSLFPLRIVEHVDAHWRLPLWTHVGVLIAITHLSLALIKGWRTSFHLMPATILILVAIPLPGVIEGDLVKVLTRSVLELSETVLPLMGYPAIISESAFIVDGKLLDVAEGCSGIRSFQSCITAALVLGELRRFGISMRLSILVLALMIAIIANTTRIIVLTRLAYTEGHTAMDQAHDSIGLWTAIITYLLIGGVAWLLGLLNRKRARIVRREV